MTYQDEFARRNARGARTGEGGDPDKPLLFRGGDGGGGDATPPLKGRGLEGPFMAKSAPVILNLFQDPARLSRKMVARPTRS